MSHCTQVYVMTEGYVCINKNRQSTPNITIMKKTNIVYWVTTILFGGFMLSTAIPNIIIDQSSIDLISTQLHYPQYIIPFLGIAKLLGALGIIIPGFPRIKEWAYAGLFFDLIGATYSAIYIEGFQLPMLFLVLIYGIGILSYVYYHKKYKGV